MTDIKTSFPFICWRGSVKVGEYVILVDGVGEYDEFIIESEDDDRYIGRHIKHYTKIEATPA